MAASRARACVVAEAFLTPGPAHGARASMVVELSVVPLNVVVAAPGVHVVVAAPGVHARYFTLAFLSALVMLKW